MATMIQGFCTTFGSASSSAAALRTLADESALWSDGFSGSLGDDSGGFGHDGERVATPNAMRKQFEVASDYAMLGFEGRGMGSGSGSNWGFTDAGNSQVAMLKILGNDAHFYLAGTLTASATGVLPSTTTYYTVEFAFGTTGGFVVLETRVNGSRIPGLTTTGFGAASGQAAGTLSSAIAAAGTDMTSAWMNFGTLGTPKVYYWWQKNHSALWTTVTTGTSFATQSDFNGVKKKFMLTPNDIAAPFNTYVIGGANTWTNGAGTHPTNLADAPIDDTLYVQNQTDAGGVSAANNRLGHGYTNLPAAATRVGMVQRTVWARTFQASPSGILARTGVRSGAGNSPANTDFFDTTEAQAPNFGSSYSPGAPNAGGTKTASIYYPRQGTLAQYLDTAGGTDVWSVATVNGIHGIFEMVDII